MIRANVIFFLPKGDNDFITVIMYVILKQEVLKLLLKIGSTRSYRLF